MLLPKGKIEKIVAASTDSRKNLQHLYLECRGDGTADLLATNGCALVRVPVTVAPEDCSGYVSCAAISAARAANKRSAFIACESTTLTLPAGTIYPRPLIEELGPPPDYSRFAPVDAHKTLAPGTASIRLNAKYLAEIVSALDATVIMLTFAITDGGEIDPHKPVTITASPDKLPGAYGVLMPVA